MSDPKQPDGKAKPSVPPPGGSTTGRSATPGAIGAELGGDLDFEPDALLDSLMPDGLGGEIEPAPKPAAEPPAADLPADIDDDDEAPTAFMQTPFTDDEATAEVDEGELEELEEVEEDDEEDDEAPTAFMQTPFAEQEATTLPHDGGAFPPDATTEAGIGPGSPAAPAAGPKPPPPPAGPKPPPPPVGLKPPPPPAAPAAAPAGPVVPAAGRPADAPDPFAVADEPSAFEAAAPVDSSLLDEGDDDQPTRVLDADRLMQIAAAFSPDDDDDDDELTRMYGGDPSDGLDSLPPPGEEPELSEPPPALAMATSMAATAWGEERPAAAHLAERDLLDDWMARAEWMEAEANASDDPQATARALLVASELWALCGDFERARSSATEAARASASSPLVARQPRWLAAADEDWKSVVATLEMEMRASPTPSARAHAAYLNGEIHRWKLGDQEAAARKLDTAARSMADDPRAHLMKLAKQLAAGTDAPTVRWSPADELQPLREATHEIARLRTGEAPPTDAGPTPAAAFEEARRHLAAGNAVGAGDALVTVAKVEGLQRAALWLAASLLAPASQTRPRSIELMQSLLQSGPTSAAVRALASRALEQGDATAISAAIADPASADAFTPGDRVALAALTGGDEASTRPWLEAVATDESLQPLAAAAMSCLSAPGTPLETGSGSEESEAEVGLGRILSAKQTEAGPDSPLRQAFNRFADTHAETALTRMLALELAHVEGDAQETADGLAQWPEAEATEEESGSGHDRLMAAALVREASGKLAEAGQDYAGAVGANPASEAATRALVAAAEPPVASDMLVRLSEALTDDAHRSLLLLEAALVRGTDDPEAFNDLLLRAAEAAPALPFAYRFGEQLARLRGDAEQLLPWLRARREASSDAIEQALDAVRESLLIADTDVELAASLIAEASAARPADVALRELEERLLPGPSSNKGAWREAAAGAAPDASKAALLIAAALEYDRAGDQANAARVAMTATELGGSELAPLIAEGLAAAGPGAAKLSEQLFEQARGESDPLAQRELYERLSRLDRARGEASSAALWQNAILERQPEHLPALRRLEHEYISAGRSEELEPIAATLAKLLDEREAGAHAVAATRARYRAGNWSEARELVEIAAAGESPSLWALRQRAAQANAASDDETLLTTVKQLGERASRAIDSATLALRGAEVAARLDRLEEAGDLLNRALELIPDHLVALTTRADVLEEAEDFEAAAEARETLAQSSNVDAHRLAAWHQAALLWLDKLENQARGVSALEQAANIEGAGDDVFTRLQDLYVEAGERHKLAELLERRLDQTSDPEERIALEVTRGRALAEIGDQGAAKAALAAALDANPDHADALDAFAEVSVAEGDWDDAEQAWIRLARHASDPDRQVAIYMKLGDLYETNLPNPERAELSYMEVVKRLPGDLDATRRLVAVYGQLDKPEKSVELQTQLVKEAKAPEDKRARTIELAQVFEEIAKDRKQAQATLEKARKAWANDGTTLRALAEFHARGGDNAAVHMLLDRAAGDARRALNTGRFDAALFDVLGVVAELRGNDDAAAVAQATLAGLDGHDAPTVVAGAGAGAGNAKLDDHLAPELLSLPLRALLHMTGTALESGYPTDLRAIRATPLPAELEGFAAQVQQVGVGFGLPGLELHVSPSLGPGCLPGGTKPPQLVLGTGLLESQDQAALSFLVIRGLKILQTGGAVLARTAPIDLWPVLAGYLSLMAPNWQPQNVDAKKLADARSRIEPGMPKGLSPDAPVLALEVLGSIGNRASQLGTAINQWGNRAALLAMGDFNAALRGLAFASGQSGGPPTAAADRKKWIMRNPEVRDLAIYSVSEQYSEARKALGLGG